MSAMCSTGTGRVLPSQIQSGSSLSTRSACCSMADCIAPIVRGQSSDGADPVEHPAHGSLGSRRPAGLSARHRLERLVCAPAKLRIAARDPGEQLSERPVSHAQRVAVQTE